MENSILSRYSTYEEMLKNSEQIPLHEFQSMNAEEMPRFAEGLFTEPPGPGLRRKRKKLADFTQDEKQARRKLKNRIAAQSARDRKRIETEMQCKSLDSLQAEVERLREENMSLRGDNQALREDNSKLRKENNELRTERTIKLERDLDRLNYQRSSSGSPNSMSVCINSPTTSNSHKHHLNAINMNHKNVARFDPLSSQSTPLKNSIVGSVPPSGSSPVGFTTNPTTTAVKRPADVSEGENTTTGYACDPYYEKYSNCSRSPKVETGNKTSCSGNQDRTDYRTEAPISESIGFLHVGTDYPISNRVEYRENAQPKLYFERVEQTATYDRYDQENQAKSTSGPEKHSSKPSSNCNQPQSTTIQQQPSTNRTPVVSTADGNLGNKPTENCSKKSSGASTPSTTVTAGGGYAPGSPTSSTASSNNHFLTKQNSEDRFIDDILLSLTKPTAADGFENTGILDDSEGEDFLNWWTGPVEDNKTQYQSGIEVKGNNNVDDAMPCSSKDDEHRKLSGVFHQEEQFKSSSDERTHAEYVKRGRPCGKGRYVTSGSTKAQESNDSRKGGFTSSHHNTTNTLKEEINKPVITNPHLIMSNSQTSTKPVAAVAPQQVLMQVNSHKRGIKRSSPFQSSSDPEMKTPEMKYVSPSTEVVYHHHSPCSSSNTQHISPQTTTVISPTNTTTIQGQPVQVVQLVKSTCGNTFFVVPN